MLATCGLAVAGILLGMPSCSPEYSLAPTFCDDWCLATLLPGCENEPNECVSDCELTKATDDCFALQEELLSCYEGQTREAFVCAGSDFSAETRVVGGICEAERDALFECEAPGIGACLSFCRQTQAEQLDNVSDSAPGLMPSEKSPDDDSPQECPIIDQPCEQLCWTVFSFTSQGLVAAGLPSQENGDTEAGDTEAGSAALCLQTVLLGCFGAGPTPSPDTPADGSLDDEPSETDQRDDEAPPSIQDILEQCAE